MAGISVNARAASKQLWRHGVFFSGAENISIGSAIIARGIKRAISNRHRRAWRKHLS